MSWQGKVYDVKNHNGGPKDWKKIRSKRIKRDKYRCRRCGSKKHLTVHHIISRAGGGSDELTNLITLCGGCHDIVEVAGFKTQAEICCINGNHIDATSEIGDTDDWRTWVYGGARRLEQLWEGSVLEQLRTQFIDGMAEG